MGKRRREFGGSVCGAVCGVCGWCGERGCGRALCVCVYVAEVVAEVVVKNIEKFSMGKN